MSNNRQLIRVCVWTEVFGRDIEFAAYDSNAVHDQRKSNQLSDPTNNTCENVGDEKLPIQLIIKFGERVVGLIEFAKRGNSNCQQ